MWCRARLRGDNQRCKPRTWVKVWKLPALSLLVTNVRVKFVWVCLSMRRPAGVATVVVMATVLRHSDKTPSDQLRPPSKHQCFAAPPPDKRNSLLRLVCTPGAIQRSSADAAAHVLKHGLLSVAAMTGGGGIGCPAGTKITGASSGSAGGTESGTESMLGLVQFRVAAEQLPKTVAGKLCRSCFCNHAWHARTFPPIVTSRRRLIPHRPQGHWAIRSRPRLVARMLAGNQLIRFDESQAHLGSGCLARRSWRSSHRHRSCSPVCCKGRCTGRCQ